MSNCLGKKPIKIENIMGTYFFSKKAVKLDVYAFLLSEEADALFSQYTLRSTRSHFGFQDKSHASAGPSSAAGKEGRSHHQPQPLSAMPSPPLWLPKGTIEISCFFLYSPWRWIKHQLLGRK